MELLKFSARSGRIPGLAFVITAALIPSAGAGDHHKTMYYLPVQTTAPTVQVAAAPVQLVTLPAKHHRSYLIPTAQYQSVQVLQTTTALATAPVAVAAAPVMMTLVPAPATVTTTVAASPPKAASGVVMINGVAYVPQGGAAVAGSPPPGTPVAASPPNADDLGGLTVDQRSKIVDGLKALYIAVKDIPGFTAESIKSIISAQAAKRYDETLGTIGDQDVKQKAVDSMTTEALGATAANPSAPAKPTATAGQQQVMMAVPIATATAAAAPVQYFLPVKAKHHLLHPHQY